MYPIESSSTWVTSSTFSVSSTSFPLFQCHPFPFFSKLVMYFCFATDFVTFSSAFWIALFYCLLLPLSCLPQNDFSSLQHLSCASTRCDAIWKPPTYLTVYLKIWANDAIAQITVHFTLRNTVKIYHFKRRHVINQCGLLTLWDTWTCL